MVGGGRPVESEFSSKCEPPVSAKANASRADKEGNATHILFASQWLQCSLKFIITPIN